MATVFREPSITIADRTSRYWKSRRLKLENSLKIYKDAQVNEFFWYSCLLGGILKTKNVPETFKKVWLICNISSIIIILSLNVVCLVWYEEKNRTTFGKFSKPVLAVTMMCFAPTIYDRLMDSIEKYTDNMDKYIEGMPFDENAKKFNGEMSKLEILVCCGANLLFIAGFFTRYFLPDLEIPDEIFNFHYPFNHNFQSYPTTILIIISFVQFLTTIQTSVGLISAMKLLKLFVALMKRTFGFYQKQISIIGSLTLQQMESKHNEELLMEQNEALRRPEDFIRQRNAIEENFGKEMEYCSRQIWRLIGIQLNLQETFENGCTLALVALYGMAIPLAGRILWVIYNPDDISVPVLNACFFFFIFVYVFYKHCSVGTEISEMMDQFPIEVYSTPWYMLSKKTRRTIHIILTQTQYERRLRVFKTVPIDMYLFYSFVDSLYSNGSFINSILERPK